MPHTILSFFLLLDGRLSPVKDPIDHKFPNLTIPRTPRHDESKPRTPTKKYSDWDASAIQYNI